MSREILFRGKRTDNGEWVKGFYANRCEECLLDAGKHYILTCDAYGFSWYEVDPNTVGQYTGLIDKNGKRIFEGDIVSGLFLHSSPVNGVVAFGNGSFGLLWSRAGVETFWAFTSICNVEYEVIGNIHDNPEMVGV